MVKIFKLRLNELPGGGYDVTLTITYNNGEFLTEKTGRLSSASGSIAIYKNWQKEYKSLKKSQLLARNNNRAIKNITNTLSGTSNFKPPLKKCNDLKDELEAEFSTWLSAKKSPEFAQINDNMRQDFARNEEMLFFIITDCQELRKLPWHSSNLFKDFQAEPIFSSIDRIETPQNNNAVNKVRILAILGNSEGIDTDKDRQELKKLPQVEIEFLVEPKFSEFHQVLRGKSWDILVFAGHSETIKENGLIYLNKTEKFSLSRFRLALEKAVNNGLQLAIFNSCDGLGLAEQLEQLNIPATIVMREPIPDIVAQTFLKEFLRQFSQGNSLSESVREARIALGDYEAEYPGASWLPIICQHHSVKPLTWKKLFQTSQLESEETIPLVSLLNDDSVEAQSQLQSLKNSCDIIFFKSIFFLGLVIGLRALGWLQIPELKAFDFLLRSRPNEAIDDRLLVVEVTETELNKYGFPLPDRTLATLMEKLAQKQPRIIGLNIYRDRPVYPGTSRLNNYFQNSDRIVGICSNKLDRNSNKPGISPPEYLSSGKIGFSDMVEDIDGVIRRHLVSMTPLYDDPCGSEFSFSLRIALKYLASEGIKAEYIFDRDGKQSDRQFKIGTLILNKLDPNAGGYYRLDDGGFQLLLNYRRNIARQVTLSQVLQGQVDPDWIRDKIVIIGLTAPSISPSSPTPYSFQNKRSLIQAQMVSQLISAVKDDRPLLWVLPHWLERFWILFWASIGGILSVVFNRRLIVLIASNIFATILLSAIAFIVLWIFGGWLPLLPPILALLLTTTVSAFVLPADKISAIFRSILKN